MKFRQKITRETVILEMMTEGLDYVYHDASRTEKCVVTYAALPQYIFLYKGRGIIVASLFLIGALAGMTAFVSILSALHPGMLVYVLAAVIALEVVWRYRGVVPTRILPGNPEVRILGDRQQEVIMAELTRRRREGLRARDFNVNDIEGPALQWERLHELRNQDLITPQEFDEAATRLDALFRGISPQVVH